MKLNPNYVSYTIKEQLFKKEVSNDAIAEVIAAFFLDEELHKSIEILNLALMKVLKLKQGQRSWIEREEKKYREEDEGKRRPLNINENGEVSFCPDDIEF